MAHHPGLSVPLPTSYRNNVQYKAGKGRENFPRRLRRPGDARPRAHQKSQMKMRRPSTLFSLHLRRGQHRHFRTVFK